MQQAVMGVDIGTSSTKGVLVDAEGTILAQQERRHGVSRPHPGWAEQDADRLWWSEFVSVCRGLLAAGDVEVTGLAVSGLGPCLLPLDDSDRPLRPAMLYAVDTRAAEQIERITARLGSAAIVERCGHPLTSQSVGPKLAWLAEHERDVYRRTARFVSSTGFIVRRLTGAYVVDHLTASCFDPFYDAQTGTWATDWIDDLTPGLQFPELAWPGEVVGTVGGDAAQETGLPVGTPVLCGTMDFWAETISVGAERAGECMVAYGTTMSVSASVSHRPGPAMVSTPGHHSNIFHAGGATAAAGALTDWVRELTGIDSYASLLAAARTVPAGADGLLMLPYFAGERAPIYDAHARGVLCGLTLRHGAGHLYRAALESSAFAVRHIFDSLEDNDIPVSRVVATGGGTRDRLWPQILTDVTGRGQHLPPVLIGASYGDALLAARATGMVDPDVRWNVATEVVEPDPTTTAIYEDLYALYRRLDAGTRDVAHALDALAVRSAGTEPFVRQGH